MLRVQANFKRPGDIQNPPNSIRIEMFNDRIDKIAAEIREETINFIRLEADKLFTNHPGLVSFGWEQAPLSRPQNRYNIISMLSVNGQIMVSEWGIKDFLKKHCEHNRKCKEDYPLMGEEIDKELDLSGAVEELISMFEKICTEAFCRFFGNRFGVFVDRNLTLIYEVEI